MKVQLDKTFPMPSSPAIAWEFLQDVEAVAGCMPGAKLTERVDENHHKGTVTVRVGPATMSFRGEVEVTLTRRLSLCVSLARAPTAPAIPVSP